MARLTRDDFKNFFKYYKEEAHQVKAIELLYDELDCDYAEHLDDDSEWVKIYRNPPEEPKPEPGTWPITKDQMGEIMGCSASSLPDSLMDDFAHCVRLYNMDKKKHCLLLGSMRS